MTTTAIVLGGGGARGSFQVGVLRFIYENPQGIRPDIICATSVGAINGVKLAEGGNKPIEGWTAFLGLENIWLGLQKKGDMYVEQTWYSTLDYAQKILFGGSSLVEFVLNPLKIGEAMTFGTNLDKIKDAVNAALTSPSIYKLDPIREKLRSLLDVSKVQSSGIKLRLAVVSLNSGRLRYITESGYVIERDGKTTISPSPVGLVDGTMASASEPVMFEPVQLLDEIYVDGGCREILPIQAAVDLGADTVYAIPTSTDGVLPLSFTTTNAYLKEIALRFIDIICDEIVYKALNSVEENIKLATEWNRLIPQYNKLATEWNIAHLPPVVPTGTRRGGSSPSVAPPSVGLATLALPLENPKPQPSVKVIRPSLYVHDPMTIDPGLIRINMGYGYMRAADVIQKNGDTTIAAFSDTITTKRIDCWGFEEVMFDNSKPISSVAFGYLPNVRTRKKEIKDNVLNRWQAGAAVPALAERWWMNWEAHNFSPTTTNPWVVYPDTAGGIAVPEEQQPLGIYLFNSATNASYLVYGGAKFPVDSSALNAMGYSSPPQADPHQAIIDNLSTIPVDGTILKEFSGLTIYLVQGGTKHAFPSIASFAGLTFFASFAGLTYFASHGFSPGDICVLPDGALSAIPDGTPLS